MTMPLSPNTAYSTGDVVKATDLNDMQQGICDGLHGYVSERVSLSHAAALTGTPAYLSGLHWQLNGSDSVRVPLDSVRQGCLLRSIRLRCRDHINASVTLSLRHESDGSIVSRTTEGTERSGADQWLTIDLTDNEYTPPSDMVRVFVDIGAVGSGSAVCFVRFVELVMAKVA